MNDLTEFCHQITDVQTMCVTVLILSLSLSLIALIGWFFHCMTRND
jgi:hypothetical protein